MKPAIMVLFLTACMDSIPEKQATVRYNEPHRPQFHFSPDSMWMNDPNGMVYYKGEYHLFYQHYPDSKVWGPMHWGHAISTDLVHWEHMPIALYPDSLGYIFSGSAVVDWQNSTGFGTIENPPLVAIFTYHDMEGERAGRKDVQSQGIAFSLDKGRTWIKYDNNPVISNPGIRDFRDPKVSWHEPTQRWIMVFAAGDHVRFYSSGDLKSWEFESMFGKETGAHGGVWECPDLFKMKVEKEDHEKWVLLVSINPGAPNGGSGTQYFIGEFDGHQFRNESTEIQWLDYGKDNYAGVTWSDIPEEDGRTLFMGWMSSWQYATLVPTSPWRSAMTFPRELNLLKSDKNYLIRSQPVSELELIRSKSINLRPQSISGETEITDEIPFRTDQAEILVKFRLPADLPKGLPLTLGLSLTNDSGEQFITGYNLTEKNFYMDRTHFRTEKFSGDFTGLHTAPFEITDSIIVMKLLVDRASVEGFFMDGMIVMTENYFALQDMNRLVLFSTNLEIELIEGQITSLKRIWGD